jgi:cell division protein ZapE
MTPHGQYQNALKREGFVFDAAQQAVVVQLQRCFDTLLERDSLPRPPGSWRKLTGRGNVWRQPSPVKGLYIWGRVGRGKTYLMDSFHHSLPSGTGLRLHFHRFMALVHEEMRRCSGSKNPLQQVARKLALQTRVLCLDELYVEDIGDAMILAGLLEALFELGLTLVATSNTAPDGLYTDGLQRQRFLPAISLLKQNTRVMALDGEVDYRLRGQRSTNSYFSPLSGHTDARLARVYRFLVPEAPPPAATPLAARTLVVGGRTIKARAVSNSVAWFDFMELCGGPRSQLDYIEISRRFEVVIVSDIPVLGGAVQAHKVAMGTEDCNENSIGRINRSVRQGRLDDAARRFIALVDEFYDQGVRLVISAAAPVESLYQGGRVSFAFRRTLSRLSEMQATE